MPTTELLREAVERAIMTYDPIRTSETEIDIDVRESGDVTLNGYVRTDTMRALASQLARRVRGVRSVKNLLLSDTELEVAVSQMIELRLGSYIIPMMPIVRAIRGHVILRGPVPSESAKEIIEEVALQVPSVVMVHNHLDVDPAAVERLVAPKKRARKGAGEEGGARQAMVGGEPVTAEDLPKWALMPKEEWGMAEYKARAKVKMAWKRGEAPDPKELEAAGAILREGLAEGGEAPEVTEEQTPGEPEPLEGDERALNPAAELEEEDVPEVSLEEVKAQFPAWALKPKEEWDKDDFKAQMRAKRVAKAGEGEPPEVIIEKAQAALEAAKTAGRKKTSAKPKNEREAALAAVRAEFPNWAIVPRKEWRPQDFAEAADARVAEIRGNGQPVTEIRDKAQAALEAALRGEAVAGTGGPKRRELTPEEKEAVRKSLEGQFPVWALKPKEEWDKADFKGQMQAKRAAKAGEGDPPEVIIEKAQAALEAALKEAEQALPLEEPEADVAEPATNGQKKEIPPDLLDKYPGWALKPKDEWDMKEFKAHAKAKSAFKKGEGPDPDTIIAEAQAAIG
ncbi:MAG: BON domain-containing protein [Chloroflexota bacterium]|nr:BON domain-containing protein [Chloroflexota bacterium]